MEAFFTRPVICYRKVGENKFLTMKKNRFNPMMTEFKKCRICKQKVHQPGKSIRIVLFLKVFSREFVKYFDSFCVENAFFNQHSIRLEMKIFV